MRLPTVRLRHKRKGIVITVNESDWAHDLGRYKWSDFERVGERHNGAGEVLEVMQPSQQVDTEDTDAPRRRGRPPKTT